MGNTLLFYYSLLTKLFATFLILSSIGCGKDGQVVEPDLDDTNAKYETALALLNEQKAKWQRIATRDHQYVSTRGCFCRFPHNTGPIKIIYKENQLDTSFFFNQQNIPDSIFNSFFAGISATELSQMSTSLAERLNIDAVFQTIETELLAKADSFYIEYHEEFHFPMITLFDPDFNGADEEFSIKIEDFTFDD